MRIQKLKLYTNKLDLEKEFYSKTLGFNLVESNSNFFTIKIGWSELTFQKSIKDFKYHYCFLIPSNKLIQSMEWMEKRVDLIELGDDRKIQRFESWNAESFYFYDASGNIAEFIVRNELNNESENEFDISQVLCVNEIGMPTKNVEETNRQLKKELDTAFWKGDSRFGTNGSQQGLFLLPNYEIKETWFPTSIKIKPEPFDAIIENQGKQYFVEFKNGIIKTTSITLQ